MYLHEALKSGRPIRRKSCTPDADGTVGCSWIVPNSLSHYTAQAVLADDWEVKYEPVMITRTQFWEAVRAAYRQVETEHKVSTLLPYDSTLLRELAKILGFADE